MDKINISEHAALDLCEPFLQFKKEDDFNTTKLKQAETQRILENQQNQTEDSQKDEETGSKNMQNSRWLVEWTPEEDDILFQRYIEIGSKWSDLVEFLPSKTDNSIKNRFYCCMRKVQRRLNKVQKEKKIKHRKLIKYESLLTFLEIGKCDFLLADKRLANANKNSEQIMEIRNIIIEIAKKPEKDSEEAQVQDLLHKFLEVKYSLKFINIQRVKKSAKIKVSEIQKFSTNDQNYTQEINAEGETEQKQEMIDDSCHEFDIEGIEHAILEHKKHKRKISLFEECAGILGEKDPKNQLHQLMIL